MNASSPSICTSYDARCVPQVLRKTRNRCGSSRRLGTLDSRLGTVDSVWKFGPCTIVPHLCRQLLTVTWQPLAFKLHRHAAVTLPLRGRAAKRVAALNRRSSPRRTAELYRSHAKRRSRVGDTLQLDYISQVGADRLVRSNSRYVAGLVRLANLDYPPTNRRPFMA